MRRLDDTLRAWPSAERLAVVCGEPGAGRGRVARWLHHHWGRIGELVVVDCALGPAHVARHLRYDPMLSPGRGTLVLHGVEQLDDLGPSLLLGLRGPFGVDAGDWALVCIVDERAAQASHLGGLFTMSMNPRQARIPPLRARRMDLPGLTRVLLAELGRKRPAAVTSVSAEAQDALAAYPWPGNVSELREVLEHALLAHDGAGRLELGDLPGRIRTPALAGDSAGFVSLAEAERRHILETLQRCGGNRGDTATALQIHANTLTRKLAAYGLGRRRVRA